MIFQRFYAVLSRVIAVAIVASVLLPGSAIAMTCSGVTYILGIEYVAECTENTSYRYVETDIECRNGQVVKGPLQRFVQGGQTFTPDAAQAMFISSAQFSSSKIFGNSEKTHFIVVTNTFAKYNGVLDGISLKPLAAAPTIHVDQLSGIAVIPKDVVDLDVDGDLFTVCDDCDDNNSAVNPSAAEVCSDGADNNCDGFADCDDAACTEDPTCAISIDIPPEDSPRDCGLEN